MYMYFGVSRHDSFCGEGNVFFAGIIATIKTGRVVHWTVTKLIS